MAEWNQVCFYGFEDENEEVEQESVQNAIRENSRNGSTTVSLAEDVGGPDSEPLRLVMFTSQFWKPGRELKIGFMSGTEWQHNMVKEYAPTWEKYANIKFVFVKNNSSADLDILIDFAVRDGSWSYLGASSRLHSSMGRRSMNLGFVTDDQSVKIIRGSILHEFGHALGAMHEHQSPRSAISWDKEQVYRDMAMKGWDRAKVDQQILNKNTIDNVQSTSFDRDSIMLYTYPSNWTTDGTAIPYNSDLSEHDKSYIEFCYPFPDLDAGQFNTLEVRPWTEPTQVSQKVKYYHEKDQSPSALLIGLNWLDINAGYNLRIDPQIIDAGDGEKFTSTIRSWSDTVLYSAGMTWLENAPRFAFAQCGTFDTSEIRSWDTPQNKNSKSITFPTSFTSPPIVVCFLRYLDMRQGTNCRIKTYTSDVTVTGFKIHIDSWDDSVVNRASASWLAYPSDTPNVCSGRFSTDDVRPWNRPQQANSKWVDFERRFSRIPRMFIALDYLDYNSDKNLRLALSTSKVANRGFQWHLRAWEDSIMNSSGASYFAWDL